MPFRLLSVCLFLVLSACSDVDNSIPPAELTEYKHDIDLNINWTSSLGGEIDPYHEINGTVYGDHIYTISSNGTISKVTLNDGQVVWQKALNLRTYAGIAVTEKYIVLGSSEGIINTFENQSTLPLVWQSRANSEVNVQPVIDKNTVYVRLSNGNLIAYDLITGKKLWRVSKRVPELSITGSSKPIVFNDLVYSGFDDGHLVAYEQSSGDMIWDKTVSIPSGRSELDRMVDIDGSFIIKNNVIYVSSFQGRLMAIQIQDGSELWSRPMSSVRQLSIDDDAIYVSDDQSNLWAIDRRTGSALWKQEALHHRQLTALTLIDNMVVTADFEGYAHWLNKQTGQLMARVQLSSNKILSAPIQYQQQVIFLDIANKLSSVSVVK